MDAAELLELFRQTDALLDGHFVLRSGLAATDERIRRLVHWLLDPSTGRPWGVAEAIAVSLDLDARKVVKLGPEALAAMRQQVYPDLRL